MKEYFPLYDQDEQFVDYHTSPFLTFSSDIHIDGDPDTEDEFDTAFCYLEVILDEFIQSGQFRQKTASDVANRLLYHNERHRYEVEQEHRSGETSTTYLEVTMYHLRALSERQLRAMAAMGWEQSEEYRNASFLHTLVDQATAVYQEIDDFMNVAVPAIYLSSETEKDTGIPF